MAGLTHDVVIGELTAAGVRADRAVLYADAFVEYGAAMENIRAYGAVVKHPRTGNPIDNPHIRVRDRARQALERARIPVDVASRLWLLMPAALEAQSAEADRAECAAAAAVVSVEVPAPAAVVEALEVEREPAPKEPRRLSARRRCATDGCGHTPKSHVCNAGLGACSACGCFGWREPALRRRRRKGGK